MICVATVKVNGQKVEQVEVMKYLDAMISSDGSMDSEVEQRIGKASKMFGAIGRTVLGRNELTKGTNLQVVNAMVIPALTFCCEAWTLQARHKGQIEDVQTRVLRRIEGVSRFDRVRIVDLGGRLKHEGVLDTVKK